MAVELQKPQEVCYWKGIFTQADLYAKPGKICEQFKNENILYGRLPPKNIAELKPWDAVYVNLLVSYSKSASQQQPDGTIINNNFRLT